VSDAGLRPSVALAS